MREQMTLPRFRELPPEARAEQRAQILAAVRPARRLRFVLAIATGVAVLAAAPTLAFQRGLVDFRSAEPAPERIQLDFGFLREHTAEASAKFGAPTYTPEGPAREVMSVMIDGERRPLWVVPTKEGGFCTRLHFTGSCSRPEEARELRPISVGGLSTSQGEGLDWVAGRVLDDAVQEVELLYQDGEGVKVPFVWVSPPIDAGFYAYDISADREEPGRLAVAVIGLDEDGEEVAHSCLPVSPDELARSVPAAAALCERRR